MNSDQIRYFQLAYHERSFSAAARQVPCSPQGLAKSIHALEKELDASLFTIDETTGLPHPTEFAHALFEFCAVYDSNLRLLHEEFEAIRGSEHHVIRLGCALGIVGVLGSEFFSTFSQLNPGIEIL